MTTELPDYIQDFNNALLSLDEKLAAAKDSLSLEETAEILLKLNRFKDDLKAIYGGVEKLLSDLMGQMPEIALSDGSRIEKNSAVSRKSWKHKDLATEVASRLKDMSVDMDTGEVVMTAEDMVVKMLDYVYPSYWKVKELGKIGINADKYSEVGEAKDSIIVRKAK